MLINDANIPKERKEWLTQYYLKLQDITNKHHPDLIKKYVEKCIHLCTEYRNEAASKRIQEIPEIDRFDSSSLSLASLFMSFACQQLLLLKHDSSDLKITDDEIKSTFMGFMDFWFDLTIQQNEDFHEKAMALLMNMAKGTDLKTSLEKKEVNFQEFVEGPNNKTQ